MNSGINYVEVLMAIVCVLIGLPILIVTVQRVDRFRDDLSYINEEIERTVGAEQQAWKARKRRLWLSLLPFYRR